MKKDPLKKKKSETDQRYRKNRNEEIETWEGDRKTGMGKAHNAQRKRNGWTMG